MPPNRRVPETIGTERLLLRSWHPDDAAALAPILADNEARLLPWIPARVATAATASQLAERIEVFASDFAAGKFFRYALIARDDGRVLGEASLFPRNAQGRCPLPDGDRVEIGYWIDAAAEGKGMVTEAVGALIGAAETLPGMTQVEIRCSPLNARSSAVPRRLGFTLAVDNGDEQVWTRGLTG